MKLAKLLEFDNHSKSKNSLDYSFGDNYLYNKNFIFKIIRDQSIQYNYTFSPEYNESYNALPLSQLENILVSKKIPYFNNKNILFEIESQVSNQVDWDEISDNLRRNSLFHESCHAVSRHVLNLVFQSGVDTQSKILQILLEESFSNSCELIGIIDVDDSAHKIFYELNSYIYVFEIKNLLKQIINEIGFSGIFKLTLLSYLHSNLLHNQMDDKTLKSFVNYLSLEGLTSDKNLKKIKNYLKVVYELNPRFRLLTTQFHLKYNQLQISHDQILKIDMMKKLQSESRFLIFIDTLCSTLIHDMK